MRTPQIAPLAGMTPLGLKPRRVSQYAEAIREDLAASGHIGKYDPRHIEGFMRLEHSTLDGLDARQFRAEVEVARQCVDLGGSDAAEECALSYGL